MPRFGPPFKTATNEPQLMEMTLMLNTRVKFPHLDEVIPVTELLFFYWMEEVHLMKGEGLDPTIFTNLGYEYHYRNELTQEVTTFNPDDLKLGFDTKIESGKFYRQHRFKFSYYCESVEGEQMTMVLVESYQHGMLFQARLTGRLCDSKYYIEIADQKEIERLKHMYDRLMQSGMLGAS